PPSRCGSSPAKARVPIVGTARASQQVAPRRYNARSATSTGAVRGSPAWCVFYALIAAMSGPGHPFPTIALVGRYGSPGIAEPLSRLAAFLAGRGHRVLLDQETAQHRALPGYQAAPVAGMGREAKLAVVLGGD